MRLAAFLLPNVECWVAARGTPRAATFVEEIAPPAGLASWITQRCTSAWFLIQWQVSWFGGHNEGKR